MLDVGKMAGYIYVAGCFFYLLFIKKIFTDNIYNGNRIATIII
jgi:hypothetical protein